MIDFTEERPLCQIVCKMPELRPGRPRKLNGTESTWTPVYLLDLSVMGETMIREKSGEYPQQNASRIRVNYLVGMRSHKATKSYMQWHKLISPYTVYLSKD